MFSVTPSLATNATALVNPYLGPVSPGLVPTEILPSAPVLMTSTPNVPVPAAAAAAAQKLMRTDRLEVSTGPLQPKALLNIYIYIYRCVKKLGHPSTVYIPFFITKYQHIKYYLNTIEFI